MLSLYNSDSLDQKINRYQILILKSKKVFPQLLPILSTMLELKRFTNLYRFYYFFILARESKGQAVPIEDQLKRWIILMLKWPDNAKVAIVGFRLRQG
jgi:hypothetical protein